MTRPLVALAALAVSTAMSLPALAADHSQADHSPNVPSIRRVQLLRGASQLELEIQASDPISPQIHAITNPDRLIVDFVNALPGAQLRNQAINRAQVKSMRVGLFSSDPPVTRIVLDLSGPLPYQVFPSGRTVIVKLGDPGVQPAAYHAASGSARTAVLLNSNYAAQPAPVVAAPALLARPALEVSYQDGLLSISANKASLSEVLFAVHQRTGAEIAIPAGAEQERVVTELGPAPAADILARLLNGTKFNFMILNSANDPRAIDQVILTQRSDAPVSAPRPQMQAANDDVDSSSVPRVPPPPQPPVQTAPNANLPDGQNPAPPPQTNDAPD